MNTAITVTPLPGRAHGAQGSLADRCSAGRLLDGPSLHSGAPFPLFEGTSCLGGEHGTVKVSENYAQPKAGPRCSDLANGGGVAVYSV